MIDKNSLNLPDTENGLQEYYNDNKLIKRALFSKNENLTYTKEKLKESIFKVVSIIMKV
jgi:hypothetical protein